MNILILAEHANGSLSPLTLHAVTAAKKLGEVHVLVAGDDGSRAVADQAAAIEGVDKVLWAHAPHLAQGLAEEVAPLLAEVGKNYDRIGAAASVSAKNILPRAAALLDASQISDVTEVVDSKTFVHPIYAGNAFETVSSDEAKLILTFRTTAFDKAAQGGSAAVEEIGAPAVVGKSRFIGQEMIKSDRPELTQARVIVSGGRALGSAEEFQKLLTPLADKLGAALGASRAAVDAGYAPNDLQVGQTGKIVAPELYIAAGISGAIQHLAGMQDSKVIVAINKDPEAPIFQVADYGLVADLFSAVPELTNAL